MGKIAFLFAGQGAQAAGMGKELYNGNGAARAVFDMGESLCPGILKLCFEGPGDVLTQTENTQPALFLTDLACARALAASGVKADFTAGFSLGEIPALAFSGLLTDADALRLVMLRGKTMAACAEEHPGSMAAVLKMENAAVEEICSHYHEIWPVNYNCPKQLSCAGAVSELDAFCDEIKAGGGRAVRLSVSGAFHTPYMKKTSQALTKMLSDIPLFVPAIPIYSNLSGALYPDQPEEMRHAIAAQASHPVRWEKTVRSMADRGVDTFIEVGVGRTLSGLVARTLADVKVMNVADPATLESTVSALNM